MEQVDCASRILEQANAGTRCRIGRHVRSPNISFADCGTVWTTLSGVRSTATTGRSERRLKSKQMTGTGRELLSEPSPHSRHRGRPPRHGGWRGRCCRHPRRYRPILLDGFPGRLPTVRSRYWPMECGRSIGANSGRPPTGLRTKTCPAAVAADSHGYISRQTWHSAVHSVRPRSTRYPCRLRHSGRESGRRTTV